MNDPAVTFVIVRRYTPDAGTPTVEAVNGRGKHFNIAIPRRFTTEDEIERIVGATLALVTAPPKPKPPF